MSDLHKKIFIGKYKHIRINDLEKVRVNEACNSVDLS